MDGAFRRAAAEVAKCLKSAMPAVFACAVAGAAVLADLELCSRIPCAENSLVEWLQFAFVVVSGALVAVSSLWRPAFRGAYVLVSAFFFDMALRELDDVLGRLFFHGSWTVFVAALTAAALFAACRSIGTVAPGLRDLRLSRHFPSLLAGLSVIFVFSRLFGSKFLWQALPLGDGVYRTVKRVAEEGTELLGYSLVLSWAVTSFLDSRARPGGGGGGGEGQCR